MYRHIQAFLLALPLVDGLSKNCGRMRDAYKDRMHSKSRINSVKTVRKNFQSKEAAMLEKKACRDSAFICVGLIRRTFFHLGLLNTLERTYV